ncbi:type IV pilus biogenesis/stability protein PilW [Massilia sp. S19_KUP03_FR1]|uniref:type IV pilus biogenesis/stability protein PilW n=1 Tax=Massilia sp. S19_KUP03_FR1 TaxID=3025503 RepID=UPI002FCCFB3E
MKAALAVVLASLVLGACASKGGMGDGGSTRELKTASDQSAQEKRATIRMQLAIGYYQDAKYEVALDEIKQAIAANPDSADAYGVRALIYTAMNETTLADENYQRALRLAPNNPDLANNYGSFLCASGARPAQAMTYFDLALKNRMYATPISALVNAGNCSLKTKQYATAEKYFTEALRYDPDLAQSNAGLSRAYFERHDYKRAGFYINRLTTTSKLDALSAETLWLAIRVARKLGERTLEASLTGQLQRRFPGSPENTALQRGAFDE